MLDLGQEALDLEINIVCPKCNGTMCIIEYFNQVLYLCGNCKHEIIYKEYDEDWRYQD